MISGQSFLATPNGLAGGLLYERFGGLMPFPRALVRVRRRRKAARLESLHFTIDEARTEQ
jgi:hypothetical protein